MGLLMCDLCGKQDAKVSHQIKITENDIDERVASKKGVVVQLSGCGANVKNICKSCADFAMQQYLIKGQQSDIACYELRYYGSEYVQRLKRSRTKEPLINLLTAIEDHNQKFDEAFRSNKLDEWDESHPLAPWRDIVTSEDDSEFYGLGMSYSSDARPPDLPSWTNHHMYIKKILIDLHIHECKFGDFHHEEDYDEEIKV